MTAGTSRNKTNLTVVLILLSASIISCSIAREFTNRPPEKTRKFNESVPAGVENAERDHKIDDPSRFKIILPEPGRILLGDPESQPIDLSTLGQKAAEFVSSQPLYDQVIYLAASRDIPSNDFANVLAELRKREVDRVLLVVSSHPQPKEPALLPENIPGPDSVLEVRLRNPLVRTDRPNPLTLVVSIDPTGRPTLNNESSKDFDELSTRLNQIFKERESNGVFREGTNEIEKTVLVKLEVEGSNQSYGDIVKLVDAVKRGNAFPVVLGDADSLLPMPPKPTEFPTLRGPAGTAKEPPKMISGGVLNGKAISLPKPPYPPAARAVNASGAVSVQVTVDLDGKVIEASAVSGHALLRAAAVAAARQARFAPTLLSGKPVKVSGILTYNFVP